MDENELSLEIGFDEILFQLSKGLTIDQLQNGQRWFGFEKPVNNFKSMHKDF